MSGSEDMAGRTDRHCVPCLNSLLSKETREGREVCAMQAQSCGLTGEGSRCLVSGTTD